MFVVLTVPVFLLEGTYYVFLVLVFIYFDPTSMSRNDHTTMTAPLPVCSAKLSIVGPG
jgi:hypothetical protein